MAIERRGQFADVIGVGKVGSGNKYFHGSWFMRVRQQLIGCRTGVASR